MSESPSEQHLEDIPLNFCSDKRFELIREPISSFYLFLDDIPPVVPVIKSPNKSTRPASTYDKHLKEDVVLKRVYYCQELVPLMVDDLRAFLLTLKESDGPLPQLSGHKIYSTRVKKLRCEEDVVKAFGYSIGFPATDMAEACVNLIPSEDAAAKVGIEFDMDEIRPKAIADNVWYLVSKSSSNSLTNRDESKRAIALVEYKSGSVGDAEFFQELITYAQQNPTFQWEFCDADWGDPKHGITHPSCDDDSDAKIVTKITSSVKTVESDSQTDPTFITSSQEKVMKVLQQVWAQACKHDLTIFMLSTYQRSVFMIRQRKTQTLFVSTVVESDPSSWNPTEATLAMIHLAYVDWRHRPSRSSSDQIRASNVVDDDLDDQDKDEGDGDHEEPSCDTDPPAQPSRKRKGSRKRGSGRRGRPRKKGRGAKPADENLVRTNVLS
ncbi:hypothetical protein FRC02_012488 [Tulasnella sp. 418]|nr:hypothetical protein FRC02_012488 [Tulasnella sp. 418]